MNSVARAPVLRSSVLRLALLYIGIVVVGVSALLWTVFLYTESALQSEADLVIQAESETLREEFADGGVARLTHMLSRRADDWGRIGAVYLLVDAANVRLAGNLSAWPEVARRQGQWLEFELLAREGDRQVDHPVRARLYELPGFRMLVGTDMSERQRVVEGLRAATFWGIGLTTLLTGLIGWWYSRRIAVRVSAVAVTCEDIISGDLARRLPRDGSSDEFDQLTAAVNHVLERIEQQTSVVRTTFASAAHDLRTPMQRVHARLETVLQSADSRPELREPLAAAITDLERVQRTLATLLQIANAESGLASHRQTSLDLAELASEMAELYLPVARERGISLAAVSEGQVRVTGNRQLLAQLLINLLENALKVVPTGGTIQIAVAARGALVELTVRDNGPGIPVESRERALQPFARLNGDSTAGSGLGLSLVAAVVRLHQGRLSFSDNNPGLSVRCELPREQ
jgi:signal transduction histidine kinase